MLKKLCVGLAALMLSLGVWAADSGEYKDGKDYVTLEFPVKTPDPSKIEVTEMFGYLCPHCNHFEPLLYAWKNRLPADVLFDRVPVVFGRSWEKFARAYYTAELLGVVDKTHEQMFDAIHKEHKRFANDGDLADFYASLGVDKDKFAKTLNSFAVDSMLKIGESKLRSYGVDGVPTMIVNGKYRVTGSTAGSNEAMLKVVDYLVEKEREAMKGASKSAS